MFKINNFSIVPKYVIFLLDLGATVTALFIAILIQQNVALAATNWSNVLNATFLMLLVNALVFTTTKSHTGIVRYTGVQDAIRIAIAVGLSSFIILVINTLSLGVSNILSLTTLVIVLYTIFSFLFLSRNFDFDWHSFKFGMNVSHQAIYIKRSLTEPYNLSYKYSSDIDWILKAAKKSSNIVNTHLYVAKYLVGGVSKKKHLASLKERFKILSHYYGFIPNMINHVFIALNLAQYFLRHRKTND